MASTQTHSLGRLAIAALALAPAALAQFPNATATTTTSSATPTATLPPVEPVFNPGVDNYTLVGCYQEPTGARALSNVVVSANQTVEDCIAVATAAGATYAGLEYGQECWYSSIVHGGTLRKPLDDCRMTCTGDAGEYCGAGDHLLLYSVGGVEPPADSTPPSQPPVIGNYTLQGCRTEATGIRALSALSYASNDMTLESCATFCDAYKYFGVEYSRECYCGNMFNNGSVPVAASQCDMVCSGNGEQFCGAGDRLSAYGKPSPRRRR